MGKKSLDKKQIAQWQQNQEQILKAIREIESQDPSRPYANISEIQRATKISRPAIYKHLKVLKQKALVFPVHAKGRGTWLQSKYAQIVKKQYEEMLKKDIDLQKFIAEPQKADENASDFREKLTRALLTNSSELDLYIKSELEWLKEIRTDYFTEGKRKLFSKNPVPLWFARQYGKIVTDFEDELVEWQNIIYNREQYYDNQVKIEHLKEATANLFKVFCDLKALVYTANFLAINYQHLDDAVRFRFHDDADQTLDMGAATLEKVIACLQKCVV